MVALVKSHCCPLLEISLLPAEAKFREINTRTCIMHFPLPS
uniref:Uncharacterized protein n=1 Tax=Anguilla anguilla TaxID=7936 RepID=A0A0E9PIQ5_ANGAN